MSRRETNPRSRFAPAISASLAMRETDTMSPAVRVQICPTSATSHAKETIMHILISSFGTQGDIQPFIAFGNGLRAAGHAVTVYTSAAYRPLVEAHGLGYAFMD